LPPNLLSEPSTLSLSQRNLLALTAALAPQPELVLLDEPSLHYDSSTFSTYIELIKNEVIEPGRTILMASCYYGEVERLAHQVGLFYQGRLWETLNPEDNRLWERHIKVTFEQEPPESLWKQWGISRVHRIVEGKPGYLVGVTENFNEIWEACRRHSPALLEEVPVDFERLLRPHLEEKTGEND